MAVQRDWFEKDYYKALGVKEGATDAEITKAYRKLAKANHPDANPGREDRFKEIAAANEVLSDPAKRKEYDEVRRSGPAQGFGGPSAGGSGFRTDDLGDLLGNLFGQGGGRGRSRGAGRSPRRGDDLETTISLSFADSVAGAITAVDVMADAACETCNATGAAPGTTPVLCSNCGGRGTIDANQGFFSFSQPCTVCGGTGMRVEKPCPTCHGSGAHRRARTVKVRIPAGVEDGQRIRLKGRGGAGVNGGQPGDLHVTVRVAAHELFGRRGSDLTLVVPVSYAEAALGATIKVPTMDAAVSVRVPPGTRSGRTLRVKGRGAQTKGGAGDLLVTVEVAVPQELTAEQRVAVEALAAAGDGAGLRTYLGV